MSVGVWADQGVIISHAAGNSPLVPNVIFEGNAKILSGNVFKMWYTAYGAGGGTNYAESTDGKAWTQYASNPVILNQGFTKIFKSGSTYYAYTSVLGGGLPAAINVYTSTDGLAFTLAKANAIVAGSAGAWDSVVLVQLGVLGQVGGTYYGYYSGSNASGANTQTYPAGLATSTDLVNWVKNPNNPIIPGNLVQADFTFAQVGSIYYGWTQVRLADIPGAALAFPSDIMRYSALNPGGPWTPLGTPTISRITAAQGVGITIGQVADPCLVSALGNLYMFYSIDSSGTNNATQQMGLAIATGMTISQLVQTYEGNVNIPIPDGLSLNLNTLASANFAMMSNANPIGGNFSPLLAGQTSQILSGAVICTTAGTPGDSYYNALTWAADQWSQVVLGTVASNSFAGAWVRMSTSGAQTGYRIVLSGGTTSGAGWALQKYVAGVFTSIGTGSMGATVNAGDTLTISVIGTQIAAYWNGVLIAVATDSAIASGAPGYEVDGVTLVGNAKLTSWSGGNFVSAPAIGIWYSVPDDRDYAIFPNNARNVQGTLTFDVPAHPSVTPPTDSRAAGAPVDSRAAANIPENSRTPQ